MERAVSGRLSNLRKGLIVSSLTALLAPAAFGGMLAGANAMAANNEDALAMATPAPKPAAVTVRPHTKLATLGRASAVAWISAGHLGR
ncbi:MAG TPA: hypothetical protein VG387_02955 [Rhizomicrobium sp.]|jgi:hypothetical protein|nr:hypothetical protein [Rhizomicrobium sp.]